MPMIHFWPKNEIRLKIEKYDLDAAHGKYFENLNLSNGSNIC
jgi:hypothetical protein